MWDMDRTVLLNIDDIRKIGFSFRIPCGDRALHLLPDIRYTMITRSIRHE